MPTAFLHPYARPAAADFVTIVRGEGARVWDDTGRCYVDAFASLWYCNVGHGRAEIADAVATQMRRLAAFHTFDRFTNEPCERLCAAVADLAPFPDARVFLTCSGSEAVDTAVKLARLTHALTGSPQRTVIVSRRPSYHGVTYGGMTCTGLPANQQHFGPLVPDIVQVDKDDLGAVQALFAAEGERIAAVITEPVIGAGGVWPPMPGYLPGLRRLCDQYGALLILDEVTCGFGRLGYWWGSERYDVQPDLITFAKGVTSGYLPLGGVLVSRRVREGLEADPAYVLRHGHTYSGHPTVCVAGLAALGITSREGLLDRAEPVGQRLAAGFEALRRDGVLTDVRGDGAVWAVGLPRAVTAPEVRHGLLERGVIARPIGDDTLAFCPPLVITDEQLDHCVEALADALQGRHHTGGP